MLLRFPLRIPILLHLILLFIALEGDRMEIGKMPV